jgi:hypothetical protein
VRTPLPALSLYQPYATLCVIGAKKYETRSQPPYKPVIGKRIAIHAAKTQEGIVGLEPIVVHAMDEAFGTTCWYTRLTYGAVVGTVMLRGAYRIESYYPDERRAYADTVLGDIPGSRLGGHWLTTDLLGNYSPGRWAWLLAEPKEFDTPYPARGFQGFWAWEPPTS